MPRDEFIRVKKRGGGTRLVRKRRSASLSKWAHDMENGRKREYEPDPDEKPLSVGITEDFHEE